MDTVDISRASAVCPACSLRSKIPAKLPGMRGWEWVGGGKVINLKVVRQRESIGRVYIKVSNGMGVVKSCVHALMCVGDHHPCLGPTPDFLSPACLV